MFINVTSCFFDVYFFIVCSKDQKLSIEYIFVIPSELQEEKHDLIKIRPYTAARSIPVVSEPSGRRPLPWRCLEKLISRIKADFHGDRRWKKEGREERAPRQAETLAGAGSGIETGTLERVKHGRRVPRIPARKGACEGGAGPGCPEGGISPPIFLSYLGTKFLRYELSLTSPTRSSPLFWRPSFFPSCGRDWAGAEPRALHKRFDRGRGRAEIGGGGDHRAQ